MTDSARPGRFGPDRRTFLETVGASGLAALAGCLGFSNGPSNSSGFTLEYVDVDGDRKEEHFKPVIDELNSQYDTKIKLNFRELPYNNMKKQLLTRVGGGNPPDVAAIDQIWLGSFYQSGKLMTFNDLEDEINFSEYFAGFQDAVKQDGDIVGFPITTDVRGQYWNKEIFEKAGLDPSTGPKTWSDLYEMGKTVHNPPKTYGVGFIVASGIFSVPLFSAGGSFLSEDGTSPTFQKRPGVQAATFVDEIYNNQSIGAQEPIYGDHNMGREFLKGNFAMTPVFGSWLDYFGRQQGMSNEEIQRKFGFSVSPHPSDGSPATMNGGFAWAAFKSTDRSDIVKDFIKHVSGKEFNRTIATKTGRIPTRKSLLDADDVWSNILWSDTIKEMLKNGHTRPVNNWAAVSEVLDPALQRVAYNKAQPKQALGKAADKLKSNL